MTKSALLMSFYSVKLARKGEIITKTPIEVRPPGYRRQQEEYIDPCGSVREG